MQIRQAADDDVPAICAADDTAADPEARRALIRRSVGQGTAYVALLDGLVVGYAILEHAFFGRGFIVMLMVTPTHRRRGVAAALVRHLEGRCKSERIFTSTNQSNRPMQSLLLKLGYKHSGTVEDLDPGDPELFFSRQLK
ncbi:MAG: GNAT family N-acetyltransferase [Myxococcota bacterium]